MNYLIDMQCQSRIWLDNCFHNCNLFLYLLTRLWVTRGAGTAYPSEASDFTTISFWLGFLLLICNLLFLFKLTVVLISFSILWNTCLTFFSDLRFFLDHIFLSDKGEFEDTKEVIRVCKSKDRQHNGQKKQDKTTNNDLQNTTQKTKDRATWITSLKTRSELRCSGKVGSSYFTSGTLRVTLVTNLVITVFWIFHFRFPYYQIWSQQSI
jgi:hypothetical protein